MRGVLVVWILVGQGPTALSVGAVGSCLDIFLSSITSISLLSLLSSLSLGDSPIYTKILSQRAVKPKTTNHLVFARASY